ncbi:MAG TPA: nucleotidyltransferase family protein [Thermoleophilaceae bacterium]|jgi:hypothetical protein
MRRSTADTPLAAAIRKLAVDAVAREALHAFADDGIHCILLKGLTLQRTLYGQDRVRRYGDVDLLVSSGELPKARAALARTGFKLCLDPITEPFRMRDAHSEDWRRGDDAVDLHWRVPGIDAGADDAWRVLIRHTESMTIGGERTWALDAEAMALLLALHATHHGSLEPKPLEDLRRGITRIGFPTWLDASRLAAELLAVDAFSAGLRMAPAGAALAARLALPEPGTWRVRVKAGEQPPAALGVLTVLETAWRGKAAAVLDALIPSPQFMRVCFPLASRGRTGLVLAYVIRGMTRARQLPAAIRAVHRARRA